MTIVDFTPIRGIIGGGLIGLSASLFFLLYGRIAGISGMIGYSALDRRPGDVSWRVMFLVGLIVGALVVLLVDPHPFHIRFQVGMGGMILAGLLVGFGTRTGGGCTSGHGICGVSRLSPRSIVATATFLAVGIITVFIVRHFAL